MKWRRLCMFPINHNNHNTINHAGAPARERDDASMDGRITHCIYMIPPLLRLFIFFCGFGPTAHIRTSCHAWAVSAAGDRQRLQRLPLDPSDDAPALRCLHRPEWDRPSIGRRESPRPRHPNSTTGRLEGDRDRSIESDARTRELGYIQPSSLPASTTGRAIH